jgi:hypothetical protein
VEGLERVPFFRGPTYQLQPNMGEEDIRAAEAFASFSRFTANFSLAFSSFARSLSALRIGWNL